MLVTLFQKPLGQVQKYCDLVLVKNSCTPSPLRYALTKKNRLEVELLCSCSLTSKVVQNK